MFKDNEDYAPINVFNKFLETVSDDNSKTVFKGLFDYKQNKVDTARNAWDEVIQNGGTIPEALRAYHESAKIPRVEMIELVNNLNVQAGFSNTNVQKHFDENGKLPRYDDHESSISFVDYTTSAKNVNSSAKVETVNSETDEDPVDPSDSVSVDNSSYLGGFW